MCNFHSAAGYLDNGLDTTLLTKNHRGGIRVKKTQKAESLHNKQGVGFFLPGKEARFLAPQLVDKSVVSWGTESFLLGVTTHFSPRGIRGLTQFLGH